jgi:hypothetical protein
MPKRSTVLTAVLVAAIGCAGCGGSSGNSGRDEGLPRLDGLYERTQSAAAVARHDHVPVSQALAENYGDFVLVIRGGQFALTQRNEHACTWQYGMIHAHRDRVDWLFTDGGGEARTTQRTSPASILCGRRATSVTCSRSFPSCRAT